MIKKKYRVLETVTTVDGTLYKDELVVFEGKDGFKHVFTEGYSSYEEALERRNELYFMSYENSKVVAIKEGQIVEAKDYMDLAYTEENDAVYGIFGDHKIRSKVMLNKSDADEILGNNLVKWIKNKYSWFYEFFNY